MRRRILWTCPAMIGGILLALLSPCAVVVAHGDQQDLFGAHSGHQHDGERRCATAEPNLHKEFVDQLRFQSAFQHNDDKRRRLQTSCNVVCDQCVEIDVHLHLIQANVTGLGIIYPHPTSTVLQFLRGDDTIGLDEFSTQDQILNLFQDNMVIVNDAFAGSPFRFRFVPERTTVSINNDWSNDAVDYRQEMSQAVGTGDLRVLDVFVAWSLLTSQDGVVLGIASLPAAQNAGEGDGLVLRYDVLAGGGLIDNDYGYTLVHEIGHWLGLFHTFQNTVSEDPCHPDEEEFGDFVDDTPVQDGPSSRQTESCINYLGNGEAPDTCPDLPGTDDIHNFMNYVDTELCQEQEGRFTCGQIERMYRHWLLFRDEVTLCEEAGDFELEIVVQLDASYTTENRIVLLTADEQTILFDSLADHLISAVIFDSETLLVDLCLPRDQTYLLAILDDAGNGFVDGTLEIYVDRALVGRVSGNFGESQFIEISAETITVETRAPISGPSSGPTLKPSEEPTSAPTEAPTSAPTNEPTSMPTTIRVRATLPPIFDDLRKPTSEPAPMPTTSPTAQTLAPSQSSSSQIDLDLLSSSKATALPISLGAALVVVLCAFF